MGKFFDACRQRYDALLARFMPAAIDRHSEQADEVARLVNLAMLAAAVLVCFIAEFAWFGLWELALSLSAAGVVMVASPWTYKKTGSLAIARESFLVSLFLFKLFESVFLASVASPGTMWFLTMPVIGIMLGSAGSGWGWLVVSTGGVLLLHNLFGSSSAHAGSKIPNLDFLYTFSLVFLGIGLVAFVLMVDASRRNAFLRLKEAKDLIQDLAIRDPLTGIFNRRHIWDRMQGEERRALSEGSPFYVCMIDLDNFKRINDTLGHAAGDIVLQEVAKAIEGEIRVEDCFGRYGGEEFILIPKSRTAPDAQAFAERIRRHVTTLRPGALPQLAEVTVSIGVARFHQGEGFAKTISRTDGALYRAKTAGRNRVINAESGHDTELNAA